MQRSVTKCICTFILFWISNETLAQNKALDAVHARLKNKENFKKLVIGALTRESSGSKFIQLANDASETIDEVDIVVAGILASNELRPQPVQTENTPSTYSKLIPPYIQNYFDEVVNYVIIEKSKDPILPDPPPDAAYDYCFPCDKDRQAQYSKDTAAYFENYFEEHPKMISKAIQVIRFFQVRIDKKLPYDKEAAARMTEKMNRDVEYLRNEMVKKVQTTWDLYKNNATQLAVLNHLVLSLHRHHQLLGIAVPKEFPDLNTIGMHMYTTFTKFYDDAVKKRDYPVTLNINWYIGLLRQTTLLYGDQLPVGDKLYEFMQSNRFEMMVDAEAKYGKGGQTLMAKIKGSNFYRAVPDKDCKLRWYLYEPNGKHMLFNLEDTQVELGTPASYIGTKEWKTPPALMELGFCEKTTRDTLLMENFMPNGKESWVIAGQTTEGQFVRGIFMNCFMDEKRVMAEAGNKAREAQLKKELMDEYNKAVKGNEYLMSKDPQTMTKEEREKLQKLVVASQEIQNKLNSAATVYSLLFKEGLKNNLKTVFEKELDGRVLFPRNTAIQYATFMVKLVHVE